MNNTELKGSSSGLVFFCVGAVYNEFILILEKFSEKVSVIVTGYNYEKYLDQCVNSILNQTYSNIELILVDDGSTDNSPKICEEYRQKYDQVRVLHKKNGGIGSSRNAGLAMASGDYVLFIDNNNWLTETHIEDWCNLLEKMLIFRLAILTDSMKKNLHFYIG